LVNNHVYALAASGDELVAGTLGGISVVRHEMPQASYTVANSGLRHNWITAVAAVGDEWMVGTYGAGLMRLDQEGHFQPLEGATAPYNVNPNALLATAGRIYVGTMGRGLGVYERATGRWSEVRDGLPSLNVTALTSGNGYLYIGTDNGLGSY
jgi:ligand-binding sensor domain-containing protein